jgi:hypothetical protein
MARRVILSDDLTDTESDDVQTYMFMVNNAYREIDLSLASFAKLEKVLAPFMKASRECNPIRVKAAATVDNITPKIREWAKSEGIEIGEKGRIPTEVMGKYHAAHAVTDDAAKTDTESVPDNGNA